MRYLTNLMLGLAVVGVAAAPNAPAYAQDGWTDAGNVVHLTTGTDRVGIGTTTPTVKLHVIGGTRIDGTLQTGVITSLPGDDLRLRLGGVNALRLERTTGAPNIIGGNVINEVSDGVEGATIGGGGTPFSAQPNVVTDDFGTIGGGAGNRAGNETGTTLDACCATVGGGSRNVASGSRSTIGGGVGNVASEREATIGGGGDNVASALGSTVGGGVTNIAGSIYSTVGGGNSNTADAFHSTVGGGAQNTASGENSTVGGGFGNVASGLLSTVPGGNRGKAIHTGSFVWADASDFDFRSRFANQFRIRSTGGAQFVSAVDGAGAPTAGVRLEAGGSSWASTSDRSLKENIAPVDGAEILRRLSAMPVTRWNLKAQHPEIKHVGPMAQDFYAAFGLGEDERYINSADVDGIALVSIQALHQIVTALEEKATALDRKTAELDRKTADVERIAADLEELRARLTRFEQAASVR